MIVFGRETGNMGIYGCTVHGRAVDSWFELLGGFEKSAVEWELQTVF